VIPGVPDSSGAYLMTISDMSTALAQVRVDEGDVTFLKIGQPASVQIDAYPGRTFSGRVQQVGAQAILSESGLTTSQTIGGNSAQQATDYPVDISLRNPPKDLLAGMTVTSVIQAIHKTGVVAVPFQALVLRPKDEAGRTTPLRLPSSARVRIEAAQAPEGQPLTGGMQGVFVVRSGRAIFTPVRIGVLGEADVEALAGIQPGEEIVVGDYAALQNLHSGMRVKVMRSAK
jgi:HlyD family secretion protein